MADSLDSIIVQTRDLTRIYGDAVEIRALDRVSLTIRRGELLAVMGASGSGKSTLLNMIGALDYPTSGQVIINNQDLAALKETVRSSSSMAPTSGATASGALTAPRADAAAARTDGSPSLSASISIGTASGALIEASEDAATWRTVGFSSFSASIRAGTACLPSRLSAMVAPARSL